jgi:hypothetical protein
MRKLIYREGVTPPRYIEDEGEMYMPEVTVMHYYSHQEGYMTAEVVIFASKERVKEVIGKHWDYIYYEGAVALLLEAGIEVQVVEGIGIDGFNAEAFDLAEQTENAPGLHFHGRRILHEDTIEDLYREGLEWLASKASENEDE